MRAVYALIVFILYYSYTEVKLKPIQLELTVYLLFLGIDFIAIENSDFCI